MLMYLQANLLVQIVFASFDPNGHHQIAKGMVKNKHIEQIFSIQMCLRGPWWLFFINIFLYFQIIHICLK